MAIWVGMKWCVTNDFKFPPWFPPPRWAHQGSEGPIRLSKLQYRDVCWGYLSRRTAPYPFHSVMASKDTEGVLYCSLRRCIRKNWNSTENADTGTRASLDLLSRKMFSPDPSMAPAQGWHYFRVVDILLYVFYVVHSTGGDCQKMESSSCSPTHRLSRHPSTSTGNGPCMI